MPKITLVNSENKELVEEIKKYLSNKGLEFVIATDTISLENYDSDSLIIYTTFDKIETNHNANTKILRIHPSLLPAFDTNNAIAEAYKNVKVTGVTIIENQYEREKILAQYPVLIGLTTSYCDLEEEIKTISKKLYPVVIDAVISDRVFDFVDLFKGGCHSGGSTCGGSCGNCSKCSN